jgi:hypothetical protein
MKSATTTVTTTATLLTASANADARLRITTTQAVSTAHTFSVYAKAGATSWLRLRNLGSNDCNGWFNLTTGAVGTVSGGTSAITSVGSGWYRCSITSTSAASIANNLLDMGAPSGDNTAASAGGETISVWGVQLEARSSVSALTVTTTQAITNYIPVLQTAASGVARFDNNPTTGESLGLLIEESRTNLLVYSEQFDNAAWVKVNSSTITANTIVAPDGTLTGDKLVRDSAANGYRVQEATSVTSGTAYTFTCYAKASQLSWVSIGSQSSFPTNTYAFFNLSSGVLGTIGSGLTSASITSVGNGWYRCLITATANATGTGSFQIWLATSDNNFSLSAGNTFDGLFLWGAQFEAGAFATSYIPTVASQVTRAADAASMTGTNFSTWYSINGGSLYGSYRIAFTSGSRYVLSIDQNIQNYVELAGNSTTNRTLLFNRSGNTLDVNITGTSAVSLTSLNQVAIAVANNDFALYLNGTSQGTDTSATLAPTLSSLEIGRYNEGSPGGYLNGTIAKIAYYPIRLSNTNLVALTS